MLNKYKYIYNYNNNTPNQFHYYILIFFNNENHLPRTYQTCTRFLKLRRTLSLCIRYFQDQLHRDRPGTLLYG